MCIINLKQNLKDCEFKNYSRRVGNDLQPCSKVVPKSSYPFKIQVLNDCILFKGKNTKDKWVILRPEKVEDYIANYISKYKLTADTGLFSRMRAKH